MPNLPRPRLRRPILEAPQLAQPPGPEAAQPDIIEAAGLRWINIERPRQSDRAWLEAMFGFHPLDFEDVYSRNQRPKVDVYDEYLFIVLQFPVYDKETNRLISSEVDLFVGPDFIVTLPNEAFPPLAAMFERYRTNEDVRETTFSKGSGYVLYKIVDTGVDASFPMLRKLGLKLERLEDDIFEGRSREIVHDISNVKQEIINFRKIVRPQRTSLHDLEQAKQRYFGEELDIYFDDITDAAERIWDILENYREVVDGLESSNESVLSHRLNDSIGVLTAVSVILLPLTLIASVFGMNVHLPLQEDPIGFWLVMLGMAGVLVAMVLYFRRRGWL